MFKRGWVLLKILVHHFAQKQETWPGELWYNMDGTKRPSHGWTDIERERIMAIKIGINGFGRIGRVVLRILAEQPDKYEVCGINLRKADVDYMVYLLKYDSVFRRFNGTVEHGVNSELYQPDMMVISNASCTTNCLAPLAKVIHQEFGIEQSLMSTIHASTAKQKAVDSRGGSDWRTGRSILNNIIPTSTDVSVVDLTARLSRTTTYAEICYAVRHASETYMKDIIGYTTDQVVSTDLIADPCPCVFDEKAGIMLDHDFVKLIAWYDNEYGYSNMVVRMLQHMYDVDQAAQAK